jgi:hypothetical protein
MTELGVAFAFYSLDFAISWTQDMTVGIMIGILAGLLGLGVGIFFALYALGFFQYLGGKRPGDIAPIARDLLFGRLLGLNDLSKPYRLYQGLNTDLVAEWKFVDAKWYGILSKSGLKQSYRAMIFSIQNAICGAVFLNKAAPVTGVREWGHGTSLHYGSSCSAENSLQKSPRRGIRIQGSEGRLLKRSRLFLI